jgi:hypothetical protein
MSFVFNSKTYVNDTPPAPNIMRYLGPGHTLSGNDYIDLTRTPAKPVNGYAGKARARFKLTRKATNGTDSLGDIIADIQLSTPVGTQESEMDAILADLAALFATAAAESLFQDLRIVQ